MKNFRTSNQPTLARAGQPILATRSVSPVTAQLRKAREINGAAPVKISRMGVSDLAISRMGVSDLAKFGGDDATLADLIGLDNPRR